MSKQQRMPTAPGRFGTWPFGSLHREIDRVFDDFSRTMRGGAVTDQGDLGFALSPNIDVAESDTSIEITAELPGVEEKDIDLTVTEDAITVKAEKKSDREEQDETKNYHLVERSYGMFQRRLAMPFRVDPDKVEASFDKGVLTVTVGKPEEVRTETRKIEVKGN